jgi:magnesium chelatase family protein
LQPSLDAEACTLLETAATRLRLSTRGQVRALRVARTVADLTGEARVRRAHVAEALAFRHRMPGR